MGTVSAQPRRERTKMMKTVVAAVIVSLVFASVGLSASAPLRRAPVQAVRPTFRVQSVAQLKAEKPIAAALGASYSGARVTPLTLTRLPALASAGDDQSIPGNPAYRAGAGVVLDA